MLRNLLSNRCRFDDTNMQPPLCKLNAHQKIFQFYFLRGKKYWQFYEVKGLFTTKKVFKN